jgi:hypothetical protein
LGHYGVEHDAVIPYIGSPIQVLGMDAGFGGLDAFVPVVNPYRFGGQFGVRADGAGGCTLGRGGWMRQRGGG